MPHTMKSLGALVAVLLLSGYAMASQPKPATEATRAANAALLKQLPFNDRQDFEFAERGLIARADSMRIVDEQGKVAWNLGDFSFLGNGDFTPSINPSLHRQAVLNMNHGLYKVADRIYQVRGFDLANITYIKGDTGWIVFDPLTVPASARAAHALLTRELGDFPIKAVVYSHSHPDHFGGVKGIVSQEQVDRGDVVIIAPRDFMEHVVKEGVLAGNAMQRRAGYQYGTIVPKGKRGAVDGALGKGVATGYVGLIAPTRVVENNLETLVIDGVKLVMQNTPDTEAPAEMNTWLPQFKTLWMAENAVSGLHNVYTIRGAQPRDAAGWSKYLNRALHQFGRQADILIASHHWPRWGNENIVRYLEKQRDMYGYLHDQALHLANKGLTINEIHNHFEVPASLSQEWFNRGYHGTVSHNVRGVLDKYIGFFDMNPANLNRLSPSDAGARYIALAGGADALLAHARAAFEQGDYRWVAEVVNHVVFADPANVEARELQADALEQLGYQAEGAGWRNAYLTAAYELRNGMPSEVEKTVVGADIIRAMSTGLVFDYMGVRLNAKRAEGKSFRINFITPDRNEQFLVELKNSHLNNLPGVLSENADLTLTINRGDFDNLLLKTASFEELLEAGKVQHKGNLQVFGQLVSLLDEFDYWFEIVRP